MLEIYFHTVEGIKESLGVPKKIEELEIDPTEKIRELLENDEEEIAELI